MPAAKDADKELGAEEAAPAPARSRKRHVVKHAFTGYYHTQLNAWKEGDVLDPEVAEWYLAGGMSEHLEPLDD